MRTAFDKISSESRKKEQDKDAIMSEDKSYQYFLDKKTNKRFFFSTEKRQYAGKLLYIAGIYEYHLVKQEYLITKSTGHRHKDEAIAWAKKHYAIQIK